jgi:uncharacterized protein YjbJ (UPF0337 family)
VGEFKDKAKGKAKQFEGRMTGDQTRRAEGMIDEAKGNLKGALHKVEDATKNIADLAKNTIKSGKR